MKTSLNSDEIRAHIDERSYADERTNADEH